MRVKHASSVISAYKSLFARHGILQTFMAEITRFNKKGPYNSQGFKSFSNQYNFILKTSSPSNVNNEILLQKQK